jgi:DNA-binding XRE family transcriptional regulator
MPTQAGAAARMPEIEHPDWAAGDAAKHLADIEYVGKMEALVFRFRDGRIFGIAARELEGLDESPITKVFLASDGYEAVVEQFSGNVLEIPWDVVLYHADPTYPYRRPGSGSPEELESLRRDEQIGERVRSERRARKWTLADLGSRTGIKVPNLSRLEKGKHSPSLDTLMKVADAFGVPVTRLIG